MLVSVSSGISEASSIYSIFPMFGINLQIVRLWCWGSFSRKITQIFSKNIFNLRVDAIEKQIIINLSRYRNMSYASDVVGESVVIFLREEKYTNYS